MTRAERPDNFDEEFYLRSNPDVARAVAEGGWASGLAHYLTRGREEGRYPAPEVTLDGHPGSEAQLPDLSRHHRDAYYLAPHDLAVSPTRLRRILIVGSCFANAWQLHVRNSLGCEGDFILTNNVSRLPDEPPRGADAYDFQIIQIAARSIINDDMLWKLKDNDVEAHQTAFSVASQRLALQLSHLLRWNREAGLLTFVVNFLVPQHNPLGRLLPRYELSNPSYFFERLNVELGAMLKEYRNAYLIDADSISASIGRRYIQDDGLSSLSHSGILPTGWADSARMEATPSLDEHYDIRPQPLFAQALWEEVLAGYRTVRQADSVKLVVTDLDDTLWRGVSGEHEAVGPEMVEGWPLGLIEALAFLKRRGVLLAIVSKNDDERIRRIWDAILRNRLALTDFAAVRINWRPKTENMKEILSELSLLPRNTVFIDDNPVERSAMQATFPDMRVLGKYPYYLRRILLWSPETQAAVVTDESSRRTEMVQAQIQRNATRKELSRDDFLSSLNLRCTTFTITGTEDARFPRSLELINKTNQFNTTGRRWTAGECKQAFAGGAVFHAFEVEDRFVGYGLVGVVITRGRTIEQFVMSCRVVGLDVEIAVLRNLMERMLSWSPDPVRAALVRTDANLLCRDLFSRCEFVECDQEWLWTGTVAPRTPPHIQMSSKVIEASAVVGPHATKVEQFAIEFRKGGSACDFLRDGWSEPEATHIWAVGPTSGLTIPHVNPASGVHLSFDVAHYIPPGCQSHGELRVMVGSEAAGSFVLDGNRSTVTCDIDARLILPDGRLDLRLEHPNFGRPSDHGHPDTRELAVCFFGATIAPRLSTRDAATAASTSRGDPRIVCLVLAHRAPAVLASSAAVLHAAGIHVLVHLDARDDLDEYRRAMGGSANDVEFINPRQTVFWGGYSMMEAEFALMDRALSDQFERLVLISDDTFPIFSPEPLRAMLAEPIDRITCNQVPEGHDFWHRYNDFWYFDHPATNPRTDPSRRLLDSGLVTAMGDFRDVQSRGKSPLHVHHGSQFWCLQRSTAERLLSFREDRDLCRSFRFAALPDELMFQSIVGNHMSDLPRERGPVWADLQIPGGPGAHRLFEDLPAEAPRGVAFIRKIAPDATALARDMADRLLRGEAVLGAAASREKAA